MLRSAKVACIILIHIDDILIVGARKTTLDELIPALQAKYTISIEIMSGPGDEVTFLKRTHQLLDNGRMVIRIHPWNSFASCCVCQSVCKTSVHQATVRLRLLTTLRS